jgi:hypothetical protein
MSNQRFCYLADKRGQVALWDLDAQCVAAPTYKALVGHSGLRGQILVRDGTKLVETPDVAPRTPALAAAMQQHHRHQNSWIYDPPHPTVDQAGDRATMVRRVQEMLTRDLPQYTVRLVGLDRRFIWYFSDGNYGTQFRYTRLATPPNHSESPYTALGNPRVQYARGPSIDAVQAALGNPPPGFTGKPATQAELGNMRPLIYVGVAYAVRVEIDGQMPQFNMCRAFIGDNLEFIASDWCQRDATRERSVYDVKNKGIDLVSGRQYTLASWLATAAVKRATDEGQFTPRNTKTKVFSMRHLLKSGAAKAPPIPTIQEALAKHLGATTVLKDAGESWEATVHTLQHRLAKGGAGGLHLVPVKLDPAWRDEQDKPFKETTQARYAECWVDGHQAATPHLTLKGYKEPPGVAAVQPKFLTLDLARLAAQYGPGAPADLLALGALAPALEVPKGVTAAGKQALKQLKEATKEATTKLNATAKSKSSPVLPGACVECGSTGNVHAPECATAVSFVLKAAPVALPDGMAVAPAATAPGTASATATPATATPTPAEPNPLAQILAEADAIFAAQLAKQGYPTPKWTPDMEKQQKLLPPDGMEIVGEAITVKPATLAKQQYVKYATNPALELKIKVGLHDTPPQDATPGDPELVQLAKGLMLLAQQVAEQQMSGVHADGGWTKCAECPKCGLLYDSLGTPCNDNSCYEPQDSQCIYTQAGVQVPKAAHVTDHYGSKDYPTLYSEQAAGKPALDPAPQDPETEVEAEALATPAVTPANAESSNDFSEALDADADGDLPF